MIDSPTDGGSRCTADYVRPPVAKPGAVVESCFLVLYRRPIEATSGGDDSALPADTTQVTLGRNV